MELVLDIESSIEFWRRLYPLSRAPKPASFVRISDCAHRKGDVAALTPSWVTPDFLSRLDGRLSVLTFDNALRRETSIHVAHAWSSRVPEGSFYALKGNVYIMSPGFMFLYAAHMLTFHELVAFGDELCGLYSFDPREKRGFRKRSVPLATTEQLAQYISTADGCYGRKSAAAALPFLIDRSASPMETFDEMSICLPYRFGGYNMPQLVMNHRVPLSPKAARIARRWNCYADMCYPDRHIDIEHHGKLDHSSPEDIASDRARVNAMKEEGYDVTELTWEQVDDLYAFEHIIARIARLMGKRLKPEELGARPQRLLLRREVLSWNHSGGRFSEYR